MKTINSCNKKEYPWFIQCSQILMAQRPGKVLMDTITTTTELQQPRLTPSKKKGNMSFMSVSNGFLNCKNKYCPDITNTNVKPANS